MEFSKEKLEEINQDVKAIEKISNDPNVERGIIARNSLKYFECYKEALENLESNETQEISTVEPSKNSLENIINNPGLEHLGRNILKHLNKKTSLALRLANHSCKFFVENSRFWLNKLYHKKSEQYSVWLDLILKIEYEFGVYPVPDLEQNVTLNLIKLFENPNYER